MDIKEKLEKLIRDRMENKEDAEKAIAHLNSKIKEITEQ